MQGSGGRNREQRDIQVVSKAKIQWKPWQDRIIKDGLENGDTIVSIKNRLGLGFNAVKHRAEVLGLIPSVPAPSYTAGKYDYASDMELLRHHAAGRSQEETAMLMNRSPSSVAHRLSVLLAKRAEDVFTYRAIELRDENIFGQAKQILKKAGYSDAELKIMSLDRVMHAANAILFKYHYPQLGKKPEWLHK